MGIMTEIGAMAAAQNAIARHPPAHWMVTPERIYQLLLMRIKDVEGQLDEAKKERDSLRKEIQLLEIQAETDKMMIANWKRQATAEEEHGHWHREAIRLAEENKRLVLEYSTYIRDDLK